MEIGFGKRSTASTTDRPTCFIAYTIKGFGLPFAGHKDNHAGPHEPRPDGPISTPQWVSPHGDEVGTHFAGLEPARRRRCEDVSRHGAVQRARARRRYDRREGPGADGLRLAQRRRVDRLGHVDPGRLRPHPVRDRRHATAARWPSASSPFRRTSPCPPTWAVGSIGAASSTATFARGRLQARRRWSRPSAGAMSPAGSAHRARNRREQPVYRCSPPWGCRRSLFGVRLLPIGTLYDPFIQRGLDALNYACYQDARFIVVANPVGNLAGARGRGAPVDRDPAHRPRPGRAGQPSSRPSSTSWRPSWPGRSTTCSATEIMVAKGPAAGPTGCAMPLAAGRCICGCRPGPMAQPKRELSTPALETADVISGRLLAMCHRRPTPIWPSPIAGAVAARSDRAAHAASCWRIVPGAGLLAVTSADRLNAGWHAAAQARLGGRPAAGRSTPAHTVERTASAPLAPGAALVTVIDGHPATLAWLGAVRGHTVSRRWGSSISASPAISADLYRHHHIAWTSRRSSKPAAQACLSWLPLVPVATALWRDDSGGYLRAIERAPGAAL